MSFLTALQFLTSIPVPGRRSVSPEEPGRSIAYFPLVGLIIGLTMAGLNWIFSLVLPSAVVNALLIVSMVMITGGLHIDGFIDTCDGIASHKTVEERWNIMHDSRVGGFGITGAVLLLLVKYVSLNSIPQAAMMTTLLFMPIAGRWAMVFALFAYPYARPSGLGKAFKEGARWPRFAAATITVFILAVLLIPLFYLTGLAVIFGVWLATVITATYLKGKFAGLTGDTYGAINEVAEVSTLIIIILLVRIGLA